MHHKTLYDYIVLMHQDKRYNRKIIFVNHSGKVYMRDNVLYASFLGEDDILIDEENIHHIFTNAYRGGGNLHVYKIINGRYRLLRVFSMFRTKARQNMQRKEWCIEKYGNDIIMLNLPTSSRISLDGMIYLG